GRSRTRPATALRKTGAPGDPERGGSEIAGLPEFSRRVATAGGLRFPGASDTTRAQRIVEEAGCQYAEECGGGPALGARDYTGTEQLAALRRHGRGRAGVDGRAV